MYALQDCREYSEPEVITTDFTVTLLAYRTSVTREHQSILCMCGIPSSTQFGLPGSSLGALMGPDSGRWEGGREDPPKVPSVGCPTRGSYKMCVDHPGYQGPGEHTHMLSTKLSWCPVQPAAGPTHCA